MKHQDYEFSPDLAWMLISGQVSDDILLEALYQEFYNDVFRLSIASLDNHRLAFKATQVAFASAIVNRYRFKEDQPIRSWFLQISLETIIKTYNSLNLKRTITANLPIKSETSLYGDSIPASSWDAEIWLTLDQLEFNKRLLALSLYYLQWEDKDITAIFNFTPEELDLNKRYLNSVLLPFRMERSSQSETSLEERIVQSLATRWPDNTIPTMELDQFVRQVTNQIRLTKIKNRLSTSSKEISLTFLVILLAAFSIWGYNHYFPEDIPIPPDPQLEMAILEATPTTIPNPDPTPTSIVEEPSRIEEIIYTIRSTESLTSIARQFDISFYGLRRNNRIPGNTNIQAGQKLWLYVDPANREMNLSKYLSQFEQDISRDEFAYQELSMARSLDTIYSNGTLLWVEGFAIDYGPDGYIGAPKVEIIQAWFTPEAVLYLIGDEQQELQEVWLLEDQYQYMATPGIERPWTHAWKPINLNSQYLSSLKLFSDTITGKPGISPVIMELSSDEYIWNGRQTTGYNIKDMYSVLRERHWVDEETKLSVRRQIFKTLDPSVILKEVIVTKIEEGLSVPPGLLDSRIPWRGGLAMNYTGQPAPSNLEILSPDQVSERTRLVSDNSPQLSQPVDFSQAWLTFQYPQILPETQRIPVELFIDQQYLGTTQLGNPWTMICERSADGSMLAYVSQPGDIPNQASRLQLVPLQEPETTWQILPFDLGVKMFAFSPDSKRLAVFGYPGRFVEGTLIVVDLASNPSSWSNSVILDHLGEASSLVWSPDGQQIAIIARYQSSTYLEEIFIYDANTGEILSRHPLDFANSQPVHFPTEEWGIEFPVEMGGISNCTGRP